MAKLTTQQIADLNNAYNSTKSQQGYDNNIDYQQAINYAMSQGNQQMADALNRARNAKIAAGYTTNTQYTNYDGTTAVPSATAYNNGMNPWNQVAAGAANTYGRSATSTGNSPGGQVPNSQQARPAYNGGADAQLQELVNYLNGEEGKYSYLYTNDPNWQAANQEYDRIAQRAGAAALAQAAGMNGGNISSNATAIADGMRQANAGQALQQIPTFANMDLQAWNASRDSKLAAADLLAAQANRNMQLYGMDNDTYTTDRNFAYQQGRDTVSDQMWQQEFERALSRDAMSDQQWQMEYDRAVKNDDVAAQQFLMNYKLQQWKAANSGSGSGSGSKKTSTDENVIYGYTMEELDSMTADELYQAISESNNPNVFITEFYKAHGYAAAAIEKEKEAYSKWLEKKGREKYVNQAASDAMTIYSQVVASGLGTQYNAYENARASLIEDVQAGLITKEEANEILNDIKEMNGLTDKAIRERGMGTNIT